MTDEKKTNIKSIILKVLKIIGRVLFISLVVICWCLSLYRCTRLNEIKNDEIKTELITERSINRSNTNINTDTNKCFYEDTSINYSLETANDYHYYYFVSNLSTNQIYYSFDYSSNGKYLILTEIEFDFDGLCYYLTNVNSLSPTCTNISDTQFIKYLDPYSDTTYNTNNIVGGIIVYDRLDVEILQGNLNSNNTRYLQITLTVYQANNTTTNYTYRYNITSDFGYGGYSPYYNPTRTTITYSYSFKSLIIDYYTSYNEGYQAGLNANDNESIYEDGYQAGLDDGKQTGVNEVINNPNNYNLYNQEQYVNYGNSKYNEGYNENATYSLESQGFLILFNSVMNAPFNILNGILNFDFMGVNLFNVFTFLITCALVIWVVKLFI